MFKGFLWIQVGDGQGWMHGGQLGARCCGPGKRWGELKSSVERNRWIREGESVMGYMAVEVGTENVNNITLVSSLSN